MFKYLTYQIDSTNQSIDEIVQRSFLPLSALSANTGNKYWYWIKLEVENQTTFDQFVVTLDQWNSATAYFKNGNGWRELVSGTSLPVKLRPLSLHRLLSFPITIPRDQSLVIYFKVRYTNTALPYFPKLYSFLSKVELDENSHAFNKFHEVQLLVVFTLGVLVILFFYHLLLCIINKEINSLLLSIYLLISALAISNSNGVATNYFFTSATAYEMQLGVVLGHLIPVLMIAFLISFLKLTKKDWELYFFFFFALLMLVSLPVSMYRHVQWLYVCRRYMVYVAIVIVVVSSIIKKREGAKVLLMALILTITTSFYAELKSVFFSNIASTGADRPYIFGVLGQMLILSSALTYRVRALQRKFEEVREEKRLLIEKQNETLKTQVDEKTQQLKGALDILNEKKEELEEVNAELSQQALSINELNQKLEQMVITRTEALQATMHDLDVFLYRASHNLRRPLMTILGISSLIYQEKDFSKIHALMEGISNTVAGMDRMLRKLIAISFCYNEQVDKEKIDLKEFIEDVKKSMIEEYGLVPERINFLSLKDNVIVTNYYLLKIIFISVIENAIQYSENPNDTVDVSLERQHNEIIIRIKDKGPGIDEIYQKEVFEMFFRGSENSKGNGLGLYLVKTAVIKLGGTVKLSSRKGNGTEIILELPLR